MCLMARPGNPAAEAFPARTARPGVERPADRRVRRFGKHQRNHWLSLDRHDAPYASSRVKRHHFMMTNSVTVAPTKVWRIPAPLIWRNDRRTRMGESYLLNPI